MNAKHTPGQWTVSSEPYKPSSSPMLAVETDDLIVAFVFTDAPDDARLIAAAPELLAALEEVERVLIGSTKVTPESRDNLYQVARAAIAKATL